MTETSSMCPQQTAKRLRYRYLRLSFWLGAAAMGLVQAWVSRFEMNPDGISYLDIGDKVWSGDLPALLNGYWSPLYGLFLGLGLKILKPSSYWEFPAVHLVNFLIYLLALVGFDWFLREFIKAKKNEREAVLPDSLWLAIGYLLFVSTSLIFITTGVVSPDMCVAACVYLDAALLLRIRENPQRKLNFILLGITLGFGYLSKTVMFPLAFVIFAVTFITARGWRRTNRSVFLAFVIFLVIAAPLVLSLSWSKRRLTFGDSGKLNYAWEVNQIPKYRHWQGDPPGSGVPRHPTRKVFDSPNVYEFAQPFSASYAPWFDPSYWYDGLETRFVLRRQLDALERWIPFSLNGAVELSGGLFAMLFVLLSTNRRRWSLRKMVGPYGGLFLISIVALFIYSMVFVSTRYLAAFVVLLWLCLFSGLRAGRTVSLRWFDNLAIWLAFLFIFSAVRPMPMIETARNLLYRTPYPEPTQWQIANGLNQLGVQRGEKVASIGDTLYAQWYRLAHVRVVAEVPLGESGNMAFWKAEPAVKEQVLRHFSEAGARAVVAYPAPRNDKMDGWQEIAETGAYVYFLRDR